MTADYNGDDNIPPSQPTVSKNEGKLVRGETTNERYMPPSSSKVQNENRIAVYPSAFREWPKSRCPS